MAFREARGQAVTRPAGAATRRAEDWIADLPGYAQLKAAGDMGGLLVTTMRTAVVPPYPWVRESIAQLSIHSRRAMIPLTLAMAGYVIGYDVFFFLALLESLGAVDRQPGGVYTFLVREIAVWVSTMIFAGVAGSAVCADLGSRKIREELDALAVLGVDQVRSLIVPRVVAMALLAPLLGLIGLFIAVASMYVTTPLVVDSSPGLFRDSLALSVLPADLFAFLFKLLIVGVFVGIVACAKGLASSGGAEGVGRSVSQTVVITFFGIWLINSIFNVAYLTLFPDSSVLRG